MTSLIGQICSIQKVYSKSGEDIETLVEAFSLILERFTMQQIKEAMMSYISEKPDIPTPSDIKTRIEMRIERSIRPNSHKHPWQIRAEQRDFLVSKYVELFRMSSVWREAEEGGYITDLRNYVIAVAKVQAQFIHPDASGIGWNGQDIFGNHPPSDDERKQFMADCKRQAETGLIDVAIPTTQIARWKRCATKAA